MSESNVSPLGSQGPEGQQQGAVGVSAPMHQQPKWYRYLMRIMVVAGVLLAVMIWWGQSLIEGKRYKVSDKEIVGYSGDATEADAKKLGDALKQLEYFDGKSPAEVLLKKDAKEGRVLSFVMSEGSWDQAEQQTAVKALGEALAPAIGGKPLTVRMIDKQLNTKKEFKID